MKLASFAGLLLVLSLPAALAAQSTVPADSARADTARAGAHPGRYRPAAFVTGNLSFASSAELTAVRATLEVPVLRMLRLWALVGAFHKPAVTCVADAHCDGYWGKSWELGVDAMPPRDFGHVLPFIGGGFGWHSGDGSSTNMPLARAGVDLQFSRVLAPRVQAEFTRYPLQGNVLLWTVGLRLGVHGVKE